MNARAANTVDRIDRTRDLAFLCALFIHTLNEARLTERVLVENFITDDRALWEAHDRKLHPELIHIFWTHRNRTTGLIDFEGNISLAKDADNVRRVLRIQIRHERSVGSITRPDEKPDDARENRNPGNRDGDFLPHAHRIEEVFYLLKCLFEKIHWITPLFLLFKTLGPAKPETHKYQSLKTL